MADDDAHLDPGSDVGGYVIDGVLGQGAMGMVYSATHPVIGKRAAIKVLRHELSNNPAAVERFILEARAVNQIGHPNIVDIFAFGTLPDRRSYYVMDLLVGESLRTRLRRTGALHVSEAASVLDEIASALIAAHDKGIIHRDLKPDNVFMANMPGRWPEVKLLDWGLLKLTSAQSSVANSRFRTLAGSVMGTPMYMSPEQARASDQVDFRTDIYALGVVSYEVLAGEPPFARGTSIDTLLAHQDEPVPSLAAKCPALPDELVQLIEAMLAKEPADRPTLAAVRAVIKRLRASKIPSMTAAGLRMELPAMPYLDTSGGQPLPLPAPPPSREVPSLGGATMRSPSTSTPMTTLAGHAMPSAPPRAATPPAGTMPPASYPEGSLPPQLQPAEPAAVVRATPTNPSWARRVFVIVTVAVVVSAIGIMLVLAT